MKTLYDFFKKYGKVILFIIGIFLFGLMAILLVTDNLYNFDKTVYEWVMYFECDITKVMAQVFSFLCSPIFLIFTAILIISFSKDKKAGYYIALNIALCFALNQIFKLTFRRLRPTTIVPGYSFPSGHSMVSLAFYGYFIYIIAHMNIVKWHKVLYCLLLASLILCIGVSRIYLEVHYASDVIAGFSLGLAYLVVYIKYFYKKMKE